jgi:hypothetical protein
MGARQNGVDGTIALLLALSQHNGRAALSVLAAAAAVVPGPAVQHWTGLEARPVRSIVAERPSQGLYAGPIVRRAVNTGENLDERRFSSAIFSN